MDDGEDYSVSYDDKNITFTATNGKVVSMKINKTVIPYNFATTIIVDLLDADGIVLASVKESTAADNDVEWTWTSIAGATYDDKLVLYSKNDTAELTVTYRPGNYDNDGNEIDVIGPQTYKIVAMDVAVDAKLLATIADNPNSVCVYDWSNVAANGENRTAYAEETSKQLHVYVTDTNGSEITQNLFEDYGYYLESSNENVLTIGSYTSHDHTEYVRGGHYIDYVGIFAEIYGVKAGTANVLIKNSEDKVVFTIKITVNAVRKFVGFDIDKASLTLSNTTYTTDAGTVSITAKDQYGSKTWEDNSGFITAEYQGDAASYPIATVGMSWGSGLNTVTFNGSGCDAGSYRYKLIFEKNGVTATRYVTVVMKEAENSGSDSYKVIVGGDTDSTYQSWATSRTTEIRIAHYKGGVLYEYLGYDSDAADTNNNSGIYIKELTITNGKYQTTIDGTAAGAVIRTTGDSGSGSAVELGTVNTGDDNKYSYYITKGKDEVLNGSGNVATVSGTAIKKAPTGNRTVKATIVDPSKSNDITVSGSFAISNNQESMTATVDEATVQAATIGEMIKEALTFKHEGYKEINSGAEANCIVVKKVKVNSNSANDINGSTPVISGQKIYVTSVVIGYQRNNTEYVEYTVPVNRTITIK